MPKRLSIPKSSKMSGGNIRFKIKIAISPSNIFLFDTIFLLCPFILNMLKHIETEKRHVLVFPSFRYLQIFAERYPFSGWFWKWWLESG